MCKQIGTLLIKGLIIRNTIHEVEPELKQRFGYVVYYIRGNKNYEHIVKINKHTKTLQLMQYDIYTDTIC